MSEILKGDWRQHSENENCAFRAEENGNDNELILGTGWDAKNVFHKEIVFWPKRTFKVTDKKEIEKLNKKLEENG